ncbi:hypothetical protein [Erythrobacter sp. KY5]|uniref:hypothetical protein n=1 Tax=Erythrobacter sp. KY5 TaxID=2011159 RepID=UPI0013A70172|nr:hypothetical protein [Erythrobacter sp. KY5]
MSESSSKVMGRANQPVHSSHFPPSGRPSGRSRRVPIYAVIGVLVLLGVAYVDGGEEPIHPISQPIASPLAPAQDGAQ